MENKELAILAFAVVLIIFVWLLTMFYNFIKPDVEKTDFISEMPTYQIPTKIYSITDSALSVYLQVERTNIELLMNREIYAQDNATAQIIDDMMRNNKMLMERLKNAKN